MLSRDGVSESQFNQVLNIELDQIIEVTEKIQKFKNSVLLYRKLYYIYLSSGMQASRWELEPEIPLAGGSEESPHQVFPDELSRQRSPRWLVKIFIIIAHTYMHDLIFMSVFVLFRFCRDNNRQQNLSPEEQWFLSLCARWNDCKYHLNSS